MRALAPHTFAVFWMSSRKQLISKSVSCFDKKIITEIISDLSKMRS